MFWSLWYDSTLDWTLVSQTNGEHSTHLTIFSKRISHKVNIIVQVEFELAYCDLAVKLDCHCTMEIQTVKNVLN